MNAPIHAKGLTKTFRGVVAVNGLDLAVEPGQVYGLIGRNGAGKTTTLRLLLGLLRADSGEARLLGSDWWQAGPALRERVGYVSQGWQQPDWMSVSDLCRYSAHFFSRWDSGLARELAGRWELPWDRPLSRLSGGHQRLASVLAALAARPDVLLLDEPAAGLDAVARRDLTRCLVDALVRVEGCAVLLCTHLLADVERLATHVGVMAHGRVVASGTTEDWQRTMRRVQVVYPGDRVPDGAEVPGAMRSERLGPVLTAIARVPDDAVLDGFRSVPGARVNVFPLTLEELFVEWLSPAAPEEAASGAENLGRSGDPAGGIP